MKKKINVQFLIVSAIASILTAVLSAVVFYETFKQETLDGLRTDAVVCSNMIEGTGVKEGDFDRLRITLIEADGKVVYDNSADTGDMNNHSDRPEVWEAFRDGSGSAVRRSTTLDRSTFYYALLLDNGMVLRVSREAGSIWSIFKKAFPIIGLIMIFIFGLCYVLTHFLARSLIKPIEQVANNMDNLQNVTVYKEMQPFVTTIQKQHQDILKSAMMRQEFTANVSHELKTPLTSISGYSELIENGMASPDDTVRFAGEIHRSANRLLTLINDIIRLSELDSGAMDIDNEPVDIYDLAQNCVSMLEINAADHNIHLHIKGEKTVVLGDRGMLEELIYNICDNAIRYNSDDGNVWVTVDSREHSIIVADDGIGISKENQKRIFERFYRVDKSRSKKTGGTGLGLAIVKQIVEQHGATIEVVSEEKVGTTIKVVFMRY